MQKCYKMRYAQRLLLCRCSSDGQGRFHRQSQHSRVLTCRHVAPQFVQFERAEDAQRAFEDKNNAVVPALTGGMPLKMQFKPPKAWASTDQILYPDCHVQHPGCVLLLHTDDDSRRTAVKMICLRLCSNISAPGGTSRSTQSGSPHKHGFETTLHL